MKFILVALSAVGLVSANVFDGQPNCIVPCLKEAMVKVDCHDPNNRGCYCSPQNREKMVPIVAPCAITHCSFPDLMQAKAAGEKECTIKRMTAEHMAAKPNRTRIGVASPLYHNDTIEITSSMILHGTVPQ